MQHTVRRYLQIVITESWTVVWDAEATPPAPPEPGSHVIEWDEGETAPEMIVLHRSADGSGWEMKSEQKMKNQVADG